MKNSIFQSILKLSTLFPIILFLLSTANAAGVLDPTFGTNGRVVTDFFGRQSHAHSVVVQPDGKIVVAGYVLDLNYIQNTDLAIVRYNPDGSLDTSFGNGGKVITAVKALNDAAYAVTIQPDGKIIVAGLASPHRGLTNLDFLIVRYNTNGTLDPTFGGDGIVTLNKSARDFFNAVAVQPDGKIVAVGGHSDGGYTGAVIRYNSDGTFDSSFGDGGLVSLKPAGFGALDLQTLALLPGNRILVGGTGNNINGNTLSLLALLDNSGKLVQKFGYGGLIYSPDTIQDATVQPDGKIITAGSNIVRYLPDGTIDPFFQQGNRAISIASLQNGRFVTIINNIANRIDLYSSTSDFIGKADSGTIARDITVQPDNKILVVGGSFDVIRYTAITSLATKSASYDGDEHADIAVLRPSNSTLHVLFGSGGTRSYPSGEASFEARRVIPEAYGSLPWFSFVYWRGGSIIGTPASFCGTYGTGNRQCIQWGFIGDIPVGGDYNGDELTDVAVFRPQNGVWYIYQSSNNQSRTVHWGLDGDKPVPADYDYDGITDIAVYRPSTGTWWILRSSDGGHFAVRFGIASDIPLTGDFDGDGFADFTVYRANEGNWYQLLTTEGFRAVRFGLATDIPVPGDYDGDGRHDIAVFREGFWYLLQSTQGFKAVQWGLPGDVPVSTRYDR